MVKYNQYNNNLIDAGQILIKKRQKHHWQNINCEVTVQSRCDPFNRWNSNESEEET